MGVAARSRPLVGKYNFWVRDLSSGIREAKFQKATGAALTVNQGEYSEGGAMAPMKEATTGSYSNVTLEHGVFENMELYTWVEEVISMITDSPEGSGIASPDQLRNFSCDQLRRNRTVLRTTQWFNCQPAGFDPGEHDNTSTDIQVETLELSMEYFHLKLA
jgi:phage tail-like protein